MAAHADAIAFADMQVLGRNPARIMPVLEAFIATAGGRAVIIGEPVWPGRTEAEAREATRHEALINLALANAEATIVCPYDAARLPGSVIASARRTHPVVSAGGVRLPSLAYQGRDAVPAECDLPLPDPPAGAQVMVFGDDLRAVRRLVADQAGLAGLRPLRTADLVLAVSEVAANTLVHTGSQGTLRVWRTADEVVCQVDDRGHIADPLAGRRKPDPEMHGGHGLWLVNRCCDLTQVRTGASGTTVRLHVSLTGES